MAIWIFLAVFCLFLSALGIWDELRKRNALAREMRALKAAADSWEKAKRL